MLMIATHDHIRELLDALECAIKRLGKESACWLASLVLVAASSPPPAAANSDVGSSSAPAVADIDGDGDLDAFVGSGEGDIFYFQNASPPSAPFFPAAPALNPNGLADVGGLSSPTFVDIDGDGDLDAFVGVTSGDLFLFVNTAAGFLFIETNPFGLANVGFHAAPAFADIDGDGDPDALVGDSSGTLNYFVNFGTAAAPMFAAAVNPFGLADVGINAKPAFADIDGDGDLDLFVGERDGDLHFFENVGEPSLPECSAPVVNPFGLVRFDESSSPAFVDVDGDGDLDALVGGISGYTRFFENRGTATAPDFAPPATVNPLCPLTADPCVVEDAVVEEPMLLDVGHREVRFKGSSAFMEGGTILASGIILESQTILVTETQLEMITPLEIVCDPLVILCGPILIGPDAILAGPGLDIRAGHSVTIDGQVRADGPAGGDVSITGAPEGVTISPTGEVTARALAPGQDGGSIELDLDGDLLLDGLLDASATGGDESFGGSIFVDVDGDVAGTNPEALLDVSGTGSLGEGGAIDLRAGGDLKLGGSIDAAGGSAGRGGELEVSAEGNVALNGGINLIGGDDGGLLFAEALGSVTLGDVNLDGTGDRGNGGEIDIRAGGSVELGGAIHSRGSDLSAESCGDGGKLSVDAGGDLTTLAEINVNAREGQCRGGEIELTGERIDIGGPVSFSGEGDAGLGGNLDVVANERLDCRNSLDGSGGLIGGGCIMIGPIMTTTLECVIESGQIELTIECDPILIDPLICGPILIEGPIIAGSPEDPSPRGVAPTDSGAISISGCNVEVAETAQLLAQGPGAFNRIVSRGETTVAGDMTATSANEFRFRPGFEPIITGQVVPAPSLNSDDTLQPCALPEDTPTRTATPTETATNTPTPIPTTTPSAANTSTAAPSETVTQSQTRTPTLTVVASTLTPTASATPGVAGPGDANCDGRISAADLVELVTLIPSSDPGDCGQADADQSGTVDEFDIPATVRLIFE